MKRMRGRGCYEGKQGNNDSDNRKKGGVDSDYVYNIKIQSADHFSEAVLREAFRVTLAVTKVDSLLRATSLIFDGNGLFMIFARFI